MPRWTAPALAGVLTLAIAGADWRQFRGPGGAGVTDGLAPPAELSLDQHVVWKAALPGRGACVHYRKSYRWFRFSCCNKVFACDRCHEEAEDHPNEWANRMICGWCSREQNYAVDECRFCGRGVIGKKGRGFWEGGKGTRDQRMMSRKDPRKYKRIGTQPGAKKS